MKLNLDIGRTARSESLAYFCCRTWTLTRMDVRGNIVIHAREPKIQTLLLCCASR